jgi:hypothetical protein
MGKVAVIVCFLVDCLAHFTAKNAEALISPTECPLFSLDAPDRRTILPSTQINEDLGQFSGIGGL